MCVEWFMLEIIRFNVLVSNILCYFSPEIKELGSQRKKEGKGVWERTRKGRGEESRGGECCHDLPKVHLMLVNERGELQRV